MVEKKISIFFLMQQMAGLRNLVEMRLSDFLINFSISHKRHKLIPILMLSTIWRIFLELWQLHPQGRRKREESFLEQQDGAGRDQLAVSVNTI